jgi:Flp pilus assembly protein TadG
MIRPLPRKIARLLPAVDGAAAVEFAIIAPALAALVVGIAQYGGMVIAFQQMHSGVEAGAVYIMRGGSDMTAAKDITLGAWPNKPADAAVTATHACSCAGTSNSCTSLCADGTYPQAFTTISASGTYTGPYANRSMNTTHVVRTQ